MRIYLYQKNKNIFGLKNKGEAYRDPKKFLALLVFKK
jgi:hypothetical protein